LRPLRKKIDWKELSKERDNPDSYRGRKKKQDKKKGILPRPKARSE